MNKTTIYFNNKVKLKDPIMIVGLPGIGNVGSLVGEHMRKELKAKRFATLYSPHFIHQALMLRNGGIRLISNRFYYFQTPKNTVILLLGDTQSGTPEGQYEVNEKIVRFFKSLKGKAIYTIGGYSAGQRYIPNPKVFGIATDDKTRKLLESNGIIFGKTSGAIWGSAGLIPIFAKKYHVPSACIMGETGMLEIDANAAKAVLGVLQKLLDLNISLDSINKIKKETEKLMKEMEAASQAQQLEYSGQPPPSKDNMTYIR